MSTPKSNQSVVIPQSDAQEVLDGFRSLRKKYREANEAFYAEKSIIEPLYALKDEAEKYYRLFDEILSKWAKIKISLPSPDKAKLIEEAHFGLIKSGIEGMEFNVSRFIQLHENGDLTADYCLSMLRIVNRFIDVVTGEIYRTESLLNNPEGAVSFDFMLDEIKKTSAEAGPDFSHRISPLSDRALTPVALVDTVTQMASKADAVLSMLKNAFAEEERPPLDADSIYYGLQSVSDELADIRGLVQFWVSQQKSQA